MNGLDFLNATAKNSMLQNPHPISAEQAPVEWRQSQGYVPYLEAVSVMEARVEGISNHTCAEQVWLLEHPPIYTAGTSAKDTDIVRADFPVFKSGRGGQATYHGPGQRVAYVMLDLQARGADVRGFVCDLEEWLIRTLKKFGVNGERRDGRVGIWINNEDREEKIAAIGVRLRRWVTFHGVSLNVDPDLSHYSGIVPCGIKEHGVTSLSALGISAKMPEVDSALRDSFEEIFGPIA
ncbi:MAG: lipoyl(octanoyl) transferase LipB [Micropepsaceae bacterium]